MTDFIDLGPAPPLEDAVPEDGCDHEARSRKTCETYIALIRRRLGAEPSGAELCVVPMRLGGSPLFIVVCYFDEDQPASVEYARRLRSHGPQYWDRLALTQLGMLPPYAKGEHHETQTLPGSEAPPQ